MLEQFQKGLDGHLYGYDPKPLNEEIKSFEENYKTWHTYLSFLKSGIRIVTCILVLASIQLNLGLAIMLLAGGFGIAELIGIIEEL